MVETLTPDRNADDVVSSFNARSELFTSAAVLSVFTDLSLRYVASDVTDLIIRALPTHLSIFGVSAVAMRVVAVGARPIASSLVHPAKIDHDDVVELAAVRLLSRFLLNLDKSHGP